MASKAGFGKNQEVEVLYGAKKGLKGLIQSSYMQNKYPVYVVRLEGDHGLHHGGVDDFKPVVKEK